MDLQFYLDKYSLENIPGMVDLNVTDSNHSFIYEKVLIASQRRNFSQILPTIPGVLGSHLLCREHTMTPLLIIIASGSGKNAYHSNIQAFLRLLTDGSVPQDVIEMYLNHYVKSHNHIADRIEYKPVLYFGKMSADYVRMFGQYGFDPNLPVIYQDKTTMELIPGYNSLGLIDDHNITGINSDSSDSFEEFFELTPAQKSAAQLVTLGADMNHLPQHLISKDYGSKTLVNVPVRPTRQLYPHTHFSDIAYLKEKPSGERGTFIKYMEDQDKQQMQKRLPTTMFLQELETLKPEQKLKLALFLENTDIEGIEAMFDFIDKISEYHDSMNPYTMRDSTGKRTPVKYLNDKLRGGGAKKQTKKKQRGGRSKRRSRRRSRRSK